jgi:hypothetical protein
MRRGHRGCLVALVAVGILLGACGGDENAAEEGGRTPPRVLGEQTPAGGNLEVFCQTSQELREVASVKPLDVERFGSLFVDYVTAAPEQVQKPLRSVVALLVFRTPVPTLGADIQAIRSFKAEHCPGEAQAA